MGILCEFCDDFFGKYIKINFEAYVSTHLSSASGPSDDVIKMAAIVLLMHLNSKQKLCGNFVN